MELTYRYMIALNSMQFYLFFFLHDYTCFHVAFFKASNHSHLIINNLIGTSVYSFRLITKYMTHSFIPILIIFFII